MAAQIRQSVAVCHGYATDNGVQTSNHVLARFGRFFFRL
jgi:hypothetical protein